MQRPLQSLAACETVFGTRNGHWFSTHGHSLNFTHQVNRSNTPLQVQQCVSTDDLKYKKVNTLAHSKHVHVRTQNLKLKPLCGNMDRFREDVQPAS